jgi:hypothetical protein
MSTLALFEEDDLSVPDTELLFSIDYQFAAVVTKDEPQAKPGAAIRPGTGVRCGGGTYGSVDVDEQHNVRAHAPHLLRVQRRVLSGSDGWGGYIGLDEALCQQQLHLPL